MGEKKNQNKNQTKKEDGRSKNMKDKATVLIG